MADSRAQLAALEAESARSREEEEALEVRTGLLCGRPLVPLSSCSRRLH